jgi:Gamma-glutamyl cyclotransferase, AIG2-like
MTHAHVFGYGSLVNPATHDYPETRPAVARGWRRAWRRTSLRPVSFLTAVASVDAEIEGLVATVPAAAWPELDAREGAYERIALAEVRHDGLTGAIAIYAIPEGHHEEPGTENPILLSYLDTVLQGYLLQFGEAGVARFVETTDGWHAPVLDDRAAPRYGRAARLRAGERELVDRWLAELGSRVIAAE